ncbi:MAG: hypothetical protein RR614_01440 [Eubacterium sp.]
MKQNLIDRYVYAVTKMLPFKGREDIEKELRTLIDDLLEERCGELLPEDRDIRVVLTELGTPSELAEKYRPEKNRYLIGPEYYSKYKLVLMITLTAVFFGILLASVITTIMDHQAGWQILLFSLLPWMGTLIMGLISAFGIVTAIFAFFEYKGINVTMYEGLEQLPPVPQKKETISRSEAIVGIVFSVIFCVIFVAAPQIMGVAFSRGGEVIPFFNLEVIHNLWYVFIAFTILGILSESFKLYEGRYTKRLAVVTVVTNLISAVLAILLLTQNQIMNPELITAITGAIGNERDIIIASAEKMNLLFLAVMLLILTIDSVVSVIRGIRYDKA